ncbi:hypothetical protein HPB49_017916 [Dermacentor silvarum]|uniref:Uncharacterized protein n=1 Tax=Dermacentor silvarum TaxID=543639 RepID=A0ACB8D6L1_DERSI|nr:hypothetical protein HPB49_017916 [Dermacentor silvarum]
MPNDLEALRELIRSVIKDELNKLQTPQTPTALSIVDVVREELRQVIRDPEHEPQPMRRTPTYADVLRQPAVHSSEAVATTVPYPSTVRSAPRLLEPPAAYPPPAPTTGSDLRGTSPRLDPARMRHAHEAGLEKEEEDGWTPVSERDCRAFFTTAECSSKCIADNWQQHCSCFSKLYSVKHRRHGPICEYIDHPPPSSHFPPFIMVTPPTLAAATGA